MRKKRGGNMYNREEVLRFFEKDSEFLDTVVKENTEKYRKGEGRALVTDKDGMPLKNAQVKIRQISHEFRFGANLFMLNELETKEKNEEYKKRFKSLFNMATLPFYWDATEPERGKQRYDKDSPKMYRRPPIDLCMEFCEKHGIEPREHALAYDAFFPKWLYNAGVDECKKALEKSLNKLLK
jgi:GH35 family endo-1,4-beta-xylanase